MITQKHKDILKGDELFRAESLSHKATTKERYMYIVALLSIFSAVVIWVMSHWENVVGLGEGVVIMALICLLFIPVFILFSHKILPGRFFVITTKGILLKGVVGNYWQEIDGYSWSKERAALKPFKGITLIFTVSCSQIIGWESISNFNTLANHLIFFTPEQIAKVDEIFKEYDVRKEEC